MSHQEISEGLDFTTRKDDKELVVDLAPDRILHHLGVHLLIILAIITKLTEVTGTRVSCYPIGETESSLQLVKYIDSFCWQSSQTNYSQLISNEYGFNATVDGSLINIDRLLQRPVLTKRFVQWLPYAMLLEAFLFALPMAYWHFTLGGVLLGHLKFMRLLLESIYESLKEIPAGIYRKEPYDEESKTFNCWRKWKNDGNKAYVEPEPQTSQQTSDAVELTVVESGSGGHSSANDDSSPLMPESSQELTSKSTTHPSVPDVTRTSAQTNDIESSSFAENAPETESSEEQTETELNELIQNVTKPDFEKSWTSVMETKSDDSVNRKATLSRGLRDRHIFSMLCYENFASMEHEPYLESVEKLSTVKSFEQRLVNKLLKNDSSGDGAAAIILPLKHAILRSFCEQENFDGNFIVEKYKRKSICTIALAATIWGLLTAVFVFIIFQTFRSDSFLCTIPYHGKHFSVCTLSGLVDVYAAFFANWIAVTLHLIVSYANLFYVMGAHNRAVTHFLDDIKPLCCIALVAAHYRKDKAAESGARQPDTT